jgi:hypothetical protein
MDDHFKCSVKGLTLSYTICADETRLWCNNKGQIMNEAAIHEASQLATHLIGLIAAGSLEPYVFWGMENQLVGPIVIDTCASIFVTEIKSDFVGKIHEVDSDASLQGLNNKVKVDGAGTIRWTIQDQYNRI